MVTQSALILVNIMVIFIVGDIHTFKISCPDPAQWQLRAKRFCNASFPSYVCLLDDNNDRVIETCERQPYIQTPGYRFVIRGGYDGKPCDSNRYQPFTFWTDGNSDCVFSKTKCEDEGQLYSDSGSTITDVSCRCDYTKEYTYVTTPLNPCACDPTREDCSCYLKTCADNMVLAADYTCRKIYDTEPEVKCPPIKEKRSKGNVNKETTTVTEQHQWKDETLILRTNRSDLHLFVILIATTFVILLGVISVLWIREIRFKMVCSNTYCHTEIENEVITCQTPGENTVESLIINRLLEKLKTKVIVTVISDCDGFRSSVVNIVASELHKRYDYDIIYSSFKLQEVANVISNTHKSVIVITDMFENDTGDMQTLSRWHIVFVYLNFHGGVKILLTCKPHVFQTYLFQHISFLSNTIFDLDLPTYLDDVNCNIGNWNIGNERLCLTYQELSALQVDQTKAKDELFLILCKRYAWKKIHNDIESVEIFFSDYDTTITQDLRLEQQKEDKYAIVALMLLIINNNCLAINMLTLNNLRLTNILSHLAALLGKPLSSNNIRDDLEILSRSYVEKSEEHYRIVCPRLHSIVLSFFSERFLPTLIQLAEPEVIRDNFVFNSITDFKDRANNIPFKYEYLYLNRICLDIREGFLSDVLNNSQMKYESFRTKFIKHLTIDDATIGTLTSLSSQVVSPLLFVAEKGYCDMVGFFVRRDFKIDVKNIKGSTPLLLACQYGHVQTVNYLLWHKADVNQCSVSNKSPLHVAIEGCNLRIVKLLLKYQCKIDLLDKWNETPLHIAVRTGQSDIVAILIKTGASPYTTRCISQTSNVPSYNAIDRTIFHLALQSGNSKLFQLLLRYGSDNSLKPV